VARMRLTFGAALAAFAAASSLPARALALAPPPPTAPADSAQIASGEPAPTLRADVYSPYERGAIDAALAEKHETVDPSPEGKRVEAIDIVTLDVIDPRDPAPTIALGGTVYSPATTVNSLHVTTKHYVVDREILLRPGEPYKAVSVEESVRNLRTLPQLSLVVAVAVRGSDASSVRLLVITKDVWSLRLAWDVEAGPGGIEDFILQPSETNFLGTHQVAALNFELDPAVVAFGAGYRVPRLEGTRNVLDASVQLIFNRASGAAEGSDGQLLAYEPLFSAHSAWAWDSRVAWNDEITRRFINAREAYYVGDVGPPTDLSAAARSSPTPTRLLCRPNPRGECINVVPWEYATRTYFAQESVTRSFGWDVKHDLSLGAFVDLRAFRTTARQADDSPSLVAAFFAQNVPRSDNRVAPFVEYHGYRSRFIRMLDFQTLGLQEDYRLGHEIYVRVYPIPKALGSTLDVVGVYGAANYTLAFGEGLVRGTVETVTEGNPNGLTQASIGGGGQVVSPRLGFGRLIYDFGIINRYRNYLNQETFLGGDGRLRGYPSNFLVGSDFVISNLELRSRPIELLHTVELGAALFYDVGDAAFGLDKIHLKQGVGAGIRALFPQLDREVFRVDFGFPVGDGRNLAGVSPWTFFIAFQQAFALPTLTGVALPSGAPADGAVAY
jgi:hypothetical protein